MLGAITDDLLAYATIGLAAGTFVLAFLAWQQLVQSRSDRKLGEENLRVAQTTLSAQHRPELIPALLDPTVRDVLPARAGGSAPPRGGVLVTPTGDPPTQIVVSVQVWNVGRGPAEILNWRLLSLDTLPEGGELAYWKPPAWDQGRRVVPTDGYLRLNSIVDGPPEWLTRTVTSGTKLWLEIPYCDLARNEEHTRWMELERQPDGNWLVVSVRLNAPKPWRNIPEDWRSTNEPAI